MPPFGELSRTRLRSGEAGTLQAPHCVLCSWAQAAGGQSAPVPSPASHRATDTLQVTCWTIPWLGTIPVLWSSVTKAHSRAELLQDDVIPHRGGKHCRFLSHFLGIASFCFKAVLQHFILTRLLSLLKLDLSYIVGLWSLPSLYRVERVQTLLPNFHIPHTTPAALFKDIFATVFIPTEIMGSFSAIILNWIILALFKHLWNPELGEYIPCLLLLWLPF